MFGSHLLNFKYDVIDVNNGFTKEELMNSKNISSAIFLLDQKINAVEFLNRIQVIALFFDSLSEEEMKSIKHWIKNTVEDKLAESAIDILEANREDVETMVANNAFILSEMREKSKAEGKAEGKAEERRKIVKRLINRGMDNRTIMEIVEVTMKEIEEIREKMIKA